MTFAVLLILLFILLFLTGLYCLYRFTFGFVPKNRPDVRQIPESNLYREHREKMLKSIDDMEATPWEKVSIVSYDGYKLYGRYYNIKKDAPLVICFHGYHGTFAWDGYGFFNVCRNNGMNILMVDQRSHGTSEGNIITFGIRERYDCKSWTEYAVERFGNDSVIYLAGVSMGAATVMMATELGLPSNVKAVISECGFSEPVTIIKETIRHMNYPVKPIFFLINLGARIFGHVNLKETNAINAVKKTDIPILFIHGKQDSVVPIYMGEELYENCIGIKELLVVEEADHANNALVDYEAYEKIIMGFLERVKNTNS